MKKLKLIFFEIRNYIFLLKTIKTETTNSNSINWKKFKLRHTLFGRIYTVISLREQDMGDEPVVQKMKAMEMMRPINEYLTELGLQEIIYPSIEQIPESRSYLIVYSPIFDNLTYSWIIWKIIQIIFLSGISFIIYKHYIQ